MAGPNELTGEQRKVLQELLESGDPVLRARAEQILGMPPASEGDAPAVAPVEEDAPPPEEFKSGEFHQDGPVPLPPPPDEGHLIIEADARDQERQIIEQERQMQGDQEGPKATPAPKAPKRPYPGEGRLQKEGEVGPAGEVIGPPGPPPEEGASRGLSRKEQLAALDEMDLDEFVV